MTFPVYYTISFYSTSCCCIICLKGTFIIVAVLHPLFHLLFPGDCFIKSGVVLKMLTYCQNLSGLGEERSPCCFNLMSWGTDTALGGKRLRLNDIGSNQQLSSQLGCLQRPSAQSHNFQIKTSWMSTRVQLPIYNLLKYIKVRWEKKREHVCGREN